MLTKWRAVIKVQFARRPNLPVLSISVLYRHSQSRLTTYNNVYNKVFSFKRFINGPVTKSKSVHWRSKVEALLLKLRPSRSSISVCGCWKWVHNFTRVISCLRTPVFCDVCPENTVFARKNFQPFAFVDMDWNLTKKFNFHWLRVSKNKRHGDLGLERIIF